MGSGRLGPTASAVLGLMGAVIGARALRRARGGSPASSGLGIAIERAGARGALVLGLLSLALGALFLAAADGGPGTGNGVVGSAAAIGLGTLAVILGALASAQRSAHVGVER
jgi:hypothetical protein